MTMPILPLDELMMDFTGQERTILRGAFTSRGLKDKTTAKLRASKPHKRVTTFEQGCTNYVWRMLCFDLCTSHPHYCIPVSADFELWWGLEAREGEKVKYSDPRRKELMDKMNELIARFEAQLPPESRKGTIRWGRALGLL